MMRGNRDMRRMLDKMGLNMQEMTNIEEKEREVPTFSEEDIILVMQQASSSREKAILALTDTKGDIAQAILNLTT